MKLLLENWRRYLSESEKAQDYGYLYLFEGDTVRKTSFYDTLNLLNENEGAIEAFLENWERSVDYHIEQLDENALADMANNPVLYLSTQAFMLIDRMKDKAVKYAGKILGVVNKIRSFMQRLEEKHPTLYKIGSFAIKIIIAMLVLYVINHIFGGGDAMAGDVMSRPTMDLSTGEISQEIIANKQQLLKIGEAASQVEGMQDIGAEILQIANAPEDVTAGVGYDIGGKVLKVIEHGVATLEKTEAKKLADAASKAAENLPELIRPGSSGGVTAEIAITQLKLAAQDGSKQALSQLQQIASQGAPEGKELAIDALKAIGK